MFGNCPRVLWERWLAPDERNRVPLACRALLVQERGGRNLLFETGIGAFLEPRLRERYGVPEAGHVLLENLLGRGLSDADVDVVVLSHLHFDHAGGLLAPWEDAPPRLLFPKARFLVGRTAWERAVRPGLRDRASFIPELPGLLHDSGRLEIVDGPRSSTLGDGYRFHRSDGHTPGMLLAEIGTGRGPMVFAADLIPGLPWVHVPITMGYDRCAELVVDEKRALLTDLLGRGGCLFFTHDPRAALARLARDASGRFSAQPASLEEGEVAG